MRNVEFIFGDKNTGTIHHKNLVFHNFNDEILKRYKLQQFIMLKQVHGRNGFAVTPKLFPNLISAEAFVGDFLMTDRPLVGLAVITADCLPVIAVDEKRGVIGIAHAGWRGTVAQIVPTMVIKMRNAYESDLMDIKFYFGPHGQPCCYEVQPDFIKNIEHFAWADQVITLRDKKIFFNNALCNQLQLFDVGVKAEQIVHQSQECTICDHTFHSHRRDGVNSQRNMNMVWLTD